MANRFARCLNTDYCSLGDQKLVMRLADGEPFFCPECAHALTPAPAWGNGARISPVLGVAAMSVLAVTSGLMVAKHWPHAVSSLPAVWVAQAPTPAPPSVPPATAHSVIDGVAGTADADMMPDPGKLFLAATMDNWLPHQAGDYLLRKRRMRPPRPDPLAVEARAALEAGVPVLPAPPALPASMPWRQAMIMAALVSPDQPLSAAPPPVVAAPLPASAPVAQGAVFPTPHAISGTPASSSGKPAIRPQTSLVPTALPAIRLAEVMPSSATLPQSAPPAPLTPLVPILRQAVSQQVLHENLAQSTPPTANPPPVRQASVAPPPRSLQPVPVAAPLLDQAPSAAAAEQRTQLALEDGLIRAVSPADDDIGARLLRTLPGSIAAPSGVVTKVTPSGVVAKATPTVVTAKATPTVVTAKATPSGVTAKATPTVVTAKATPIHKMMPPVAAKPARIATLADGKPVKHAVPARRHIVAPEAVAKAAPLPPTASRRPAAASVASIAPASLPDSAATPDAPAPRSSTVVMQAGLKVSYGPLKDVKLPEANGIFMTARPSAAQPEKGRLLVDCVIETTGVPSNCRVLHAENAAGVQDAVLAMLVSGMVHKTPKTEDGHPVRARQTWTMEFPAESQR